ncbi:feruloyl esteras-like protein B precursor [Clathrospora elynae]|uniref:Carboxylic ester hydrolase n=1 Tax=Clathrospora elynae TaxID=706981 RepID=A0A6A5SC41_9PLEO|nr:feruloyl esteras-like protein B precursor [Clathrospora elynae]
MSFRNSLGQQQCTSSAFQNLQLSGSLILNIGTQLHSNLSFDAPAEQNHYPKTVVNLEACEVIITHTHPGYNDKINTVIWLPSAEKWTGRFMGAGGGGWSTGVETNTTLPWAASEGFAVVSTDGGHVAGDISWSQVSPGNVNWVMLQDFASTALDDAATLGKAVVKAYYGKAPSYSYWNGCSTGGRQGHMMAQRYPGQYDGILAAAPAIYWNELMMQLFWPQAVMNELGEYPALCDFEVINVAAMAACDELDGLKDGIISLPGKCDFDPTTVIDQQYICPSTKISTAVTKAAATVAKATWQGAKSPNGDSLWHGQNVGSSLIASAATTCNNGTCTGAPFVVSQTWITDFVIMDRKYDTAALNTTVFDSVFHQAVNRYDSVIGTSDPDLTRFHSAGGKLITWHGLADMCVAPSATADYARRVYEHDPNASEYYRLFEAPGVDHCGGGLGWYPGNGLNSLIDWVEKGIAPDTLAAEQPKGKKANLCLWPKHLVYVKGDSSEATSFECR